MDSTPRIMLVDDQADWIRLNKNALQREGFTCDGFTERDKALAAFSSNPVGYALVVLDVNLGGQPDGVIMAKRFFAIKPDVNLVLISTQAQLRGHEGDLEEIAQSNGLKYFRKKGDEEGGRQLVNIAKQYFVTMPKMQARTGTESLAGGALLTWLEAKQEPPSKE